MTIAAFDPRCLDNYTKRKYLLHIQWEDGTGQICRYALVETMGANDIEHRTKQKYEDETELSQLEIFIPGILSMIEYTVVNSPVRLEEQLGISEGNVNHGEMTLDQFFFMRPTVSAAQYKSPIQHLYLCGPGTHPGGGLHGANGFNAATEII